MPKLTEQKFVCSEKQREQAIKKMCFVEDDFAQEDPRAHSCVICASQLISKERLERAEGCNAIRWNAKRGALIDVTGYPSNCEVVEDALDLLAIRIRAHFNEADDSRILELYGLNNSVKNGDGPDSTWWHVASETDVAALRHMVQQRTCIRPELQVEDPEPYMREVMKSDDYRYKSPDGIFVHLDMPPDEFRDALFAAAFKSRNVNWSIFE